MGDVNRQAGRQEGWHGFGLLSRPTRSATDRYTVPFLLFDLVLRVGGGGEGALILRWRHGDSTLFLFVRSGALLSLLSLIMVSKPS